MSLIFAADLWQKPDDYEPPVIHHDDPLVMEIAKVLLDNSPEHQGWDYQMDGASQMDGTQRGDYYGEPYARVIEAHIKVAEAVRRLFP